MTLTETTAVICCVIVVLTAIAGALATVLTVGRKVGTTETKLDSALAILAEIAPMVRRHNEVIAASSGQRSRGRDKRLNRHLQSVPPPPESA